MAAALVDTQIVSTASNATLNGDYPASIASGDLILISVAVNNGATPTTFTTPSGYTALGSEISDAFSPGRRTYYKVAAGTESGAFTITQSQALSGHVVCCRITGHNSVDTAAGFSFPAHEDVGTTTDSPSVTTAVADELVIVICRETGPSNGVNNIANPSGVTDSPGEVTLHTAFVLNTRVGYFVQASAGATGAKTWTGITDGAVQYADTIGILTPASGAAASIAVIQQNYRNMGLMQ
jgi:hypothetical protein